MLQALTSKEAESCAQFFTPLALLHSFLRTCMAFRLQDSLRPRAQEEMALEEELHILNRVLQEVRPVLQAVDLVLQVGLGLTNGLLPAVVLPTLMQVVLSKAKLLNDLAQRTSGQRIRT